MWEPMKPAPPPTQTLAPLPAGRVQDFISDMVGFDCVLEVGLVYLWFQCGLERCTFYERRVKVGVSGEPKIFFCVVASKEREVKMR